MEEKLEECIDNEINESMTQNNISNIVQLKTREVIHEKMFDHTFLESAKRKAEDLNSQIQVKEDVINTLNNKHLEYGKRVNQINQNLKTISAATDALNNKQENCASHVHQYKKTLKYCSLLPKKIDFVKNKIFIDINRFNAEIRNRQIKYTDEIKELELMHKKQDEDYNQQCTEYNEKFEKQNLLFKELEQEGNIIAAQLKESENNMNSLDTDMQDAVAQKSEVLVKCTDMKQTLDFKTKEFDMETDVLKRAIEDLQISLQEKKDRYNEIQQESQQAQLKLDEQSTRMNCLKETQSNFEKQALDLEQEYRDLENQYASLKAANEIELSDVQLKLREKQLRKNALEKECLEIKEENVRLRNKSDATKQTIEDIKVTINRDVNIYKERQSNFEKIETSIQEMKYNKDIEIKQLLAEQEKGKKEIEEYKTKIKMLNDNIESRTAYSIQLNSNIENLRLRNEKRALEGKVLLQKLNKDNLILEDRLKEMNENIPQVLLIAEEKMQNVRETSRTEIKDIKESIRTYKTEIDDSWKQEEQALLERKKSMNAALKSKRMEAEKLRLSLEQVKNEIKNKSSLIVSKIPPPASAHMEKFLLDTQKNALNDTVTIDDNIVNISPVYSASRKTGVPEKRSLGTWKNAWSGSTTEEMFARPPKEGQKNAKNLTDPEFINLSTSDSDSDKELKKKRRATRKTRASKPATRGRKTKKLNYFNCVPTHSHH